MKIQVLDHGFIELLNISGPIRRAHGGEEDNNEFDIRSFDADDTDPAISARMSFNNFDKDRKRQQDPDLCRYLMKNKHTSPFEMIVVWIGMKLPIFVARQFVRHRTTSINEVSGRYVTLPAEWYIPETVGGKAPNAKQGQADNLEHTEQAEFKFALNEHCHRGYIAYTEAIARGVAPEHARLFLSLNHYTHWVWKQDLHNLFHFLSLRDHSHAQIEAQRYAQAISRAIREVLPHSMSLYGEFRKL